MDKNLKTFWYLIGIGLFFCWLALEPTAFGISPVRASSQAPVNLQNFPSANLNLTFDDRLAIDEVGYSFAQLPGEPTYKTKWLKETKPHEMKPPSAPKVSPPAPPPVKHQKPSGRIINVRTFGSSQAGLEKAIGVCRKEGGTLYFSTGSWNITTNLMSPSSVAVKFARGALLKVATTKASGTISYADD
ncbi:MAG: hypothetical protein P8168_14985, partial [Deltaproteobacteria bacterium]